MFENLTTGVVVSGLVLGMIGFVVFLYGKREGQLVTLIAGLVLGILPMVMHGLVPLWIVSGVVLGGVILHRRNSDTTAVA